MILSRHTINQEEPLSAAMQKMNEPQHLRIIFVLNERKQVIGSITDGDIRRGLLKGLDTNTSCENFAFKDFKFINADDINISSLQQYKESGIFVLPVLNSSKELIKIINFNSQISYLPLSAVIMAGGFGNRLRPLTINTPKPMLKVGDLPILEINIRRLVQFGIHDIVICVNYLKEQIINYFGDGSKWNCEITYIEENEPLGTIGAISLQDNFKYNDILLFNADLLSTINLEDMYLKYQSTSSDLIIAGIPHKITLPYAVLEQSMNRILNISEKPTYTYFSNAGFYIFSKRLTHIIPKNTFFNATDFVEELIKKEHIVTSFEIFGYWNDIGSIEDYEKSNNDILSLNLFQ